MTAQPQDHKQELPDTVTISTRLGDVTLPHPGKMDSGIIRKARKQTSDVDQLFFIVESLADEDTLDLLDQLNMIELAEFYKSWTQGANLGESSSSES